jgi:hypothetical protein
MNDFITTTGKNIGKIKNTEFGNFVNLGEGAMRNLEKKHPLRYKMLYIGALCKANNITKEDLIKLVENRG